MCLKMLEKFVLTLTFFFTSYMHQFLFCFVVVVVVVASLNTFSSMTWNYYFINLVNSSFCLWACC